MSRSKHPVYHLGPLGQFCSGSGQDVDFVHLPCHVVSRPAEIRADCTTATELRAVLTAHRKASGKRFHVDDVMAWALDHSTPMGPAEVTANWRHMSVDIEWLRYGGTIFAHAKQLVKINKFRKGLAFLLSEPFPK